MSKKTEIMAEKGVKAHFTVGKPVGSVPDGLFGMNMEITRKTFFGGLSAQLINNRKFYATDADGMPCGWKVVKGRVVTDNPEASNCRSNYVVLEPGGELICEQELFLKAGKRYVLTVCAGSEINELNEAGFDIHDPKTEPGCISVTVGGSHFRRIVPFRTGRPLRDRLYRFVNPSKTYENARFRIRNVSDKMPVSVFMVSLMPQKNFNGLRWDAVKLLKRLRPSHLRYPGGCCADHIEWDEFTNLPDDRKPFSDNGTKWFLFPDTYGQDCSDFGPEEFLKLAKYVGAEPEFTVGIVEGKPEKAADLVRRVKSLPCGRHVRRWYIGNEPYYFGGEYTDGKKAAEMCDRYVEAMRAADPDIKVVGGICADFHHDEWDEAFIKNSKTVYDEFSFHNYCGAATDTEEQDISQKEAVSRIFMNGVNPRLDCAKYVFLKDVWNTAEINVDEWNLTWGQYGSTLMMFADALMMHFLIKSSGTYNITNARFFHPVNEGMIRVTPKKAYLDTVGILFENMNLHRGGLVANVDCDCENADICATVHLDYTALSAVNRGWEPVRLVSDFLEGAEITCLTFEKCSADDDKVTVVCEKAENGELILGPCEILFAVKR